MAFADRAKTNPVRIHGSPCSICELLKKLPKGEAASLQVMLTDVRPGSTSWKWSQSDLYLAIRDEGHEVGRQSINRHRSGNCRGAKAAS